MLNKSKKEVLIKATIKNIMVAFIYTAVFFVIVTILFGRDIKKFSSMINLISIETTNKMLEDVNFDLKTKTLTSYPEYGTKYASLEIPSLDIDLPVYYGDTLAILKNGIGHSSGSYFPGEGGSILYMGHNNAGILRRLSEIKNNASIIVKTTYGTYTYKVYDTNIIDYKDIDAVPINHNEEILMIYTCHPATAIGHTTKRFVAYARLSSTDAVT